MTNKYEEFAKQFVAQNAVGYPQDLDVDACFDKLAKQCAAEAKSAGLNASRFEFELGMALAKFIEAEMTKNADREVERLTESDD